MPGCCMPRGLTFEFNHRPRHDGSARPPARGTEYVYLCVCFSAFGISQHPTSVWSRSLALVLLGTRPSSLRLRPLPHACYRPTHWSTHYSVLLVIMEKPVRWAKSQRDLHQEVLFTVHRIRNRGFLSSMTNIKKRAQTRSHRVPPFQLFFTH